MLAISMSECLVANKILYCIVLITSQIQNTHLKPKCVQPPVTGKQFQCFDFNVYKHENVNMVKISW